RVGRGFPAGLAVYEGSLLSKSYQGSLLQTDAGAHQLRCYPLKTESVGLIGKRAELAQSKDPWFRPIDVGVAPDGSVFVADWYDPNFGPPMLDTTRGRIYRIAPRGHKPSTPKLDLDSKAGLLAALGSPAPSVRSLALARLDSMDRTQAVDILEAAAVQNTNIWLRARALWQLGRLGRLRLLNTAFIDPDPRFRILAIRVFK